MICQLLRFKETTVLPETRETTIFSASTTVPKTLSEAVATKEDFEEKRQAKRKMIADSSPASQEPSDLYWVLPSYSEPFKKDIKNMIMNEKTKLCSSKEYKIILKMFTSNLRLLIAET